MARATGPSIRATGHSTALDRSWILPCTEPIAAWGAAAEAIMGAEDERSSQRLRNDPTSTSSALNRGLMPFQSSPAGGDASTTSTQLEAGSFVSVVCDSLTCVPSMMACSLDSPHWILL